MYHLMQQLLESLTRQLSETQAELDRIAELTAGRRREAEDGK